jgi:hypothetical protein
MASSSISSGNVVTRFQSEVFRTYVRGGKFGKDTGSTENAIIQVNRDLKKHSIPLVSALDGAPVQGSASLVGNETALSNYAFTFTPTYHRKGVLISDEENEKAEFDLFREARPALMNWAMEWKRDSIIQALGAIEAGDTYYNYGGSYGATGASAASAANMDTWNAANADRILYGAAKSNQTANNGDHTACLGTIDTTADKIDAGMITLAKRMAENADPLIRPVMVNDEEPWFVLYVGNYGFRQLKADSSILAANKDARPREVMNNPIFTGGDMVYEGIIIKKIPEIDKFIDGTDTTQPWSGVWGAQATGDNLVTSGDTTSRVGVAFLCGAQAVAFGLGRAAQFKRRKEDDYDFQKGVGIVMKHDIRKIFYNGKQHGVFTIFHSDAVDS